MAEYNNTNRGALYRNRKKESEKHPDYNGQINVNGVDYWLSAWLKESKTGEKFFSMSVRPKEERQSSQPTRKAKDDFEDAPF